MVCRIVTMSNSSNQMIPGSRGASRLRPANVTAVPSAAFRGLARDPARLEWVMVVVAATLGLGGCAPVPVWKQERVSKPNMLFNDRGAFVYGPRINAQVEPGAADNGGATAAGCTACK
jgi:hypothetical protein